MIMIVVIDDSCLLDFDFFWNISDSKIKK